jgi:hypothetical protein
MDNTMAWVKIGQEILCEFHGIEALLNGSIANGMEGNGHVFLVGLIDDMI